MGHECNKRIEYEFGITNIGNISRLVKVLKKAEKGEEITLAFIGGSITMGSLSSTPETCYAYNVYKWMCKQYPKAKINYVNAGIGATDSQYGCARVHKDVLNSRPDLVFVEFSVNDENTEHFKETYEGLVRCIYYADNMPAVMIIHNVMYDTGLNAEEIHADVAEYYEIPAVSMKSAIYPYVEDGRIKREDITPDNLHPNDEGHKLVANTICYAIEWIDHGGRMIDETSESFKASLNSSYEVKKPITLNGYERSVRYANDSEVYSLEGFVVDEAPQAYFTDIFKNGFIGKALGDKITFRVEGSSIGIQYRKSVNKPAPVAKVIVDGQSEYILDANFIETWGDKLQLDTLIEHAKVTSHELTIEIIEATDIPFYLVSVIASI